jgi:glycosyltransferase involved in cell wall biosynthesis
MKDITVFTSSYNRTHTLSRLYKSLLIQSFKNFEWLIVDDGSEDDTEELISGFIKEKIIEIRYWKQENGGKHRAINYGAKAAQGELFFIVDSDDYLADNALERVDFHYKKIRGNECFAGVCGLKVFFNGEKVGGESNFSILECSSIDFRFKHKVKGDMAEVFRTDILRKYPFPEIEGEYFCPESMVWNKIAENYKLRYFYEKIYFCDYLPDGLTAKISRIRMQSTVTSMMYYSELYKMKIPFIQKVKAAINFWRFAFCSFQSFNSKLKLIGPFSLFFLPLGYLFYLRDLKT